MPTLPLDQAIPRFKQNEERLDIFTNGADNIDFVPSSGPVVPSLRKKLKQVNDLGIAAGQVLFDLWSQLLAVPPVFAGQRARVDGPDTTNYGGAGAGNHIDPITAAVVANKGSYRGSMAPLGWRWHAADDIDSLRDELVAARGPAIDANARLTAIESNAVALGAATDAAFVSTNDRLVVVSDRTAYQERFGCPTTPVTGGALQPSMVYIFANKARLGGRIKKLSFRADAAGTLKIQTRSRDVNNFTRINTQSFTVIAAGDYAFPADIVFAENSHIAYFPTAGMIPAPVGASVAFLSSSGPVTDDLVIISGAERHDFVPQIGLDVDYDAPLKNELLSASQRAETANTLSTIALRAGALTFLAGIPAEPVTGLSSAAGMYLIAGARPYRTRAVGAVKWFCLLPTSVTPFIGTKSGTTVNIVKMLKPLNIEPGLVKWNVDLVLEKNQFIGILAPGAGWCSYTAGVVAAYEGFWYAAWGPIVGGAFTVGALSRVNTLQLQIELQVLEPPKARKGEMVFDRDSGVAPKIFGKQTVPVAGGNLNAAMVAFLPPVAVRSLGGAITWYANVASTTRWMMCSYDGTTFNMVQDFGTYDYAAGLQSLPIDDYVLEADQWFIGQGTVSGWMATSVNAHAGWLFKVQAIGLNSMVPASYVPNITSRPELQITSFPLPDGADVSELNFLTSDQYTHGGESFQRGSYMPEGTCNTDQAGQTTDWLGENISQGGAEASVLRDILNNDTSVGFGTRFSYLRPKKALISLGKNDYLSGTILSSFENNLGAVADSFCAAGSLPEDVYLFSQAEPIYGSSGAASIRGLAESKGMKYVPMIPRFAASAPTANADWIQSANYLSLIAGWHPGVRVGFNIVMEFLKIFATWSRPKQSVKIFQLRDEVIPATIDDVFYADAPFNYPRLRKWRPLNMGHYKLADPNRYDSLNQAPALAAPVAVNSEILALQNGSTLALKSHVLLHCVLDATPANMSWFDISVSDPTVEIYVRTIKNGAFVSGSSSYKGTLIGTGSARITNFLGKMAGDVVSIVLYKAGGMTITMPKIKYCAKRGKPQSVPVKLSPAAGAEGLASTNLNSLAGLTVTGALAVSTDATFGLPTGYTSFVALTSANWFTESLTFPTSSVDREIEISAYVEYLPPVRTDPASVAPLSITKETCLFRQVYFELVDAAGKPSLATTGETRHRVDAQPPAGLSYEWVRARTYIPAGAADLKLSIRTDADGVAGVMRIVGKSCRLVS